eukprot:TRINITY_DN7204_c0_g1_i1.p1 TRINITY_DN7204_c0_g1~~TRINITY_DN7204_c0_g1_i1.p1  ORF type:complete len:242 (+),score=35.23 TRINITY_DN7204_c0_g1_i1:102-827(+)
MTEGQMEQAKPLYSNQHLLDHDWGDVTAAFLQKFPDPDLKYVKSVETVNRLVCESKQTMHLRRLFYCGYKVPALAEKVLGKRTTVICVEEAHWDMKRRRLTVHGRNETGQKYLRIDEVCCYTEVGPGQTLYTQSATVSFRRGVISGFLTSMASEVLAGICQKNSQKGLNALVARSERERKFRQEGYSEVSEAVRSLDLSGAKGQSQISFGLMAAGVVGLGLAWQFLPHFGSRGRGLQLRED